MRYLFEGTSRISKSSLTKTLRQLNTYRTHLQSVVASESYEADEASLVLPTDKVMVREIKALAKKVVSKKLRYNIVVGIGGSNLGTKAIYDALEDGRGPEMLFADTVSAELILRLQAIIKKSTSADEILITVISKSGGTTETIANAEVLLKTLIKRFKKTALSRVVVITDEGSKLWHKAGEQGMHRLAIPAKVGGRFSVFSAVGLFPLQVNGFNIDELLSGAQAMREDCLASSAHNPALVSAGLNFLSLKQGYAIHDSFFFHPEMESLGKWYRQLMGESIGKEKDLNGKKVEVGITPTVSIGSTDLHSMAQLYLGGPRDKFTTFVTGTSKAARVPKKQIFSGLVEGVAGVELGVIMQAIQQGTQIAYKKRGNPYVVIELSGVNLRELGSFLQFKMMEMMYLGRLLNVNTFDQPNVELYKVETKRLLKG
jgi:glucose-6-phosphate isomerase